MSGSVLTEREVDNIIASYQREYAKDGRLIDFIRSVWKEAYDEGHDNGYKLGVVEGFNKFKIESKR
jgi:hypothetical protein